MEGNKRYVQGVARRHDFKHEREPLTRGQNPFAAILSCADSRIAPEYCFDAGRGDLFVCRVAGNFANDESIASFELRRARIGDAADHGARARFLRRRGRHHQVDQGQHHLAGPSAVTRRRARAGGQGCPRPARRHARQRHPPQRRAHDGDACRRDTDPERGGGGQEARRRRRNLRPRHRQGRDGGLRRGRHVEWAERLVRRSAEREGGSEVHADQGYEQSRRGHGASRLCPPYAYCPNFATLHSD